MLSLQSPHNSHKPELLQQAISPSFRNKRIPSAHESYSYSSNHNLKISKTDSPSKLSQKLKRRKSQYINSSSSYLDKNDLIPHKKKSAKSITQVQANHSVGVLNVNSMVNGPTTPSSSMQTNPLGYPQNIINQMNCLKNQYKQLKSAYQQLIEEKINNSQKMAQIKQENRKLQAELQIALQKLNSSPTHRCQQPTTNPSSIPSAKPTLATSPSLESISPNQLQQLRVQNQKLKQKLSFTQLQLERIKKECYKLLQAEKFKSKKLEQSLKQKEHLLNIVARQTPDNNCEYAKFIYDLTNNRPFADITQSVSPKNIQLFKPFANEACKNLLASPKMLHPNINKPEQANTSAPNPVEESLFISQDKSFIDQTYNNQSQFISISLTSVMEESVCRAHDPIESILLPKVDLKASSKPQPKSKQPIDLTHLNLTQSTETVMPHLAKQSSKRQKLSSRQHPQTTAQQPNHNMKKMRKQVHQKLELNLNHFENNRKQSFLNLKTPISTGDKKLMAKNKNSKSKKKQQDKENNQNYYHAKDVSELNAAKITKKKQKNQSLTHK